jgi:hypothetical protein
LTVEQVLQRGAHTVWRTLTDAHKLGVALHEETLTDLVSMELASARPILQVRQFPRRDEAVTGADWDWWIGSHAQGWVRVLIQAKKLFLPGATYKSLRHKVADGRDPPMQLERLAQFALKANALPYYCFFNGNVVAEEPAPDWGCTLAQLGDVRWAHEPRRPRDFFTVRSECNAIPWHRCFNHLRNSKVTHEKLPDWVRDELLEPEPDAISESILGSEVGVPCRAPAAIQFMMSSSIPGIGGATQNIAEPPGPKNENPESIRDFRAKYLVVFDLDLQRART